MDALRGIIVIWLDAWFGIGSRLVGLQARCCCCGLMTIGHHVTRVTECVLHEEVAACLLKPPPVCCAGWFVSSSAVVGLLVGRRCPSLATA